MPETLLEVISSKDILWLFHQTKNELQKCVTSENNLLKDLSIHLIKAGGKYLRPLLLITCATMRDCDKDKIIKAATAVELIHLASLIHDDIIDESSERRGVSTLNTLTSNTNSVLTGDYLFATAFGLLTQTDNVQTVSIMSNAVRKMCEGQVMEYNNLYNYEFSEGDYLSQVRKKTGSLLAASCILGSHLCNMDKQHINALGTFGINLGYTFQIFDDILDFTSNNELIGKPIFQDISQGLLTLPVIYALSHEEYGREISPLISRRNMNGDTMEEIINLIRKTRAIQVSYNKAINYLNHAIEDISLLPPSDSRLNLLNTAEFILQNYTRLIKNVAIK